MPHIRFSKPAVIIAVQIIILSLLVFSLHGKTRETASGPASVKSEGEQPAAKDYIRWVDFTVTAEALEQAFRFDMNTCQNEIHLDWIEMLAFLGARYGGDFSLYKQSDLDSLAERLQNGETIDGITADMKSYDYYHEAYSAVLGGMVGYFEQEIDAADAPQDADIPGGMQNAGASGGVQGVNVVGSVPGAESVGGTQSAGGSDVAEIIPAKTWVTKYGLKAFFPIARNFPYNDYDDFGVSRSYGFKRRHLGHDMMGQVGTPIIAVESGTVEALGWNQYGGWRIGIRSFDQKRYYYYAHLRKNYPYQSNLAVGSTVTSGDVIGYLGRTGYSTTENTNNIDTPHLHFGLQLIFDESQKEGDNEIWIDCYELVKFLNINQSPVVKVEGTKEWTRVYGQKETREDR